jgi:hypothetical protein
MFRAVRQSTPLRWSYWTRAASNSARWPLTHCPNANTGPDIECPSPVRLYSTAVIHCTAGDALITGAALVLAILAARRLRWPLFGGRMLLAAVLLGLGYTVFSE